MSDYLKKWVDSLLEARPLPLRRSVTVLGERDAHLGPRCEVARVQVTVEPAQRLEVVDGVQGAEQFKEFGYPDWVVLGLLDVLMVAPAAPMRMLRITLEKLECDPINSSPMALRQAGRDAGRKIMLAISGKPESSEN